MNLDPWSTALKGSEHAEQQALIQWANMAANFGLRAANFPDSYNIKGRAIDFLDPRASNDDRQPLLSRLFAIHNQGHGDQVRGARAKAEGLKTGVPDLCLPVTRYLGLVCSHLQRQPPYNVPETSQAYCGLYIELKTKNKMKAGVRKAEIIDKRAGKASTQQEDWINFLQSQGYCAIVAYGWEEARDIILNYLGLT